MQIEEFADVDYLNKCLEEIYVQIRREREILEELEKTLRRNQKGMSEEAKTSMVGQIQAQKKRLEELQNSLLTVEMVILQEAKILIDQDNKKERDNAVKAGMMPRGTQLVRDQLSGIREMELPRGLRKKYGNMQAYVEARISEIEQRVNREVAEEIIAKYKDDMTNGEKWRDINPTRHSQNIRGALQKNINTKKLQTDDGIEK